MTYSDTGKRDTLYYRLLSQSAEEPGLWGHEYVRHLAAELGEEYTSMYGSIPEEQPNGNGHGQADGKPEERKYTVDQLKGLALELVDFFFQHNAEADAVDLMLELEGIGDLVGKVDEKTWPRVCQYMVRWVVEVIACSKLIGAAVCRCWSRQTMWLSSRRQPKSMPSTIDTQKRWLWQCD